MRVKLPRFLQKRANIIFSKVLKISLLESAKNSEEFQSFEEVFTRKLKPHSRPVQDLCVSPADGKLIYSEASVKDHATQIKGIQYSLSELCGQSVDAAWFFTVYLAPHNYHRVHSPISGNLESIEHIPGFLWPVHEGAVRYVPQLFCKNERVIFKLKSGQGFVFVVMVGAFNVGRITTDFWPEFTANTFKHSRSTKNFEHSPITAGDELGVFQLGSTVVVILDKIAHTRFQLKNDPMLPKVILCGEKI